MNFSCFFLALHCALASIILLREGAKHPEILIVQYVDAPGVSGLPFFSQGQNTATNLAVLGFRFRDADLTVKDIRVPTMPGYFDYRIVYRNGGDKTIIFNPVIKHPFHSAKFVPLSAFLNGELFPPLHNDLAVAGRDPTIINLILDIFPSLPRPGVPVVNVARVNRPPVVRIVPPVVPFNPIGPILVARLNGFGNAEVLVDSTINGFNIPVLNLQTIQSIFQCSQLEYDVTHSLHICRSNYNFDGGLNTTAVLDNVLLSWVSVYSPPFMNTILVPNGMEAFLKRLVLDASSNINPNSRHGCQSQVAVLRGTYEHYGTCSVGESLALKNATNLGIRTLQRLSYNPQFAQPNPSCQTVYSFVEKDTFKAAIDVLDANPGSHVMVVNFANNRGPGGGYLNGAKAQEEDLFRCSNLPWILGEQGGNHNLYPINEYNSANALYNSNCVIMRDRSNGYAFTPPDKNYLVSVCSVPAFDKKNDRFAFVGNSNKFSRAGEEGTYYRIHLMFQMAIAKGVDTLILGAFGCGAFGNDPIVIREYFEEIMMIYNNRIPHVQFAVIAPGDNKTNLKVFSQIRFPQ